MGSRERCEIDSQLKAHFRLRHTEPADSAAGMAWFWVCVVCAVFWLGLCALAFTLNGLQIASIALLLESLFLLEAVRSRRMLPIHQSYRRLITGKCALCGYDLRGTPGHCPECGTYLPQSGSAAG
jgi:hypothetical protein